MVERSHLCITLVVIQCGGPHNGVTHTQTHTHICVSKQHEIDAIITGGANPIHFRLAQRICVCVCSHIGGRSGAVRMFVFGAVVVVNKHTHIVHAQIC